MFGRRKREEAAAADAAREAERRALFTRLAERPEAICPFLGLADDRTGYVEGISDDHRCFAFGDPSPISAEQQTRVCQEPGYGNCPRYLRGVLVIPTEELEALRKPRAPMEVAVAAPPPEAEVRRRRAAPILLLLGLLVLVGGGAAAFLLLGGDIGTAQATPTPTDQVTPALSSASAEPPTAVPSPSAAPTAEPTPSIAPSGPASPTPEPTPELGDEFAFYEVSVAPDEYTLYTVDGESARIASFAGYSFAQVAPVDGADGQAYWVTQDGNLAGWAYRYPDSGEFRIRAVYLNSAGQRRSVYLEQSELDEVPEAPPAP